MIGAMPYRILWLAAAGIFACVAPPVEAVTLKVWLSQAVDNCTQTPEYRSNSLRCAKSEPVQISLKTEDGIKGPIPASISTLTSLTRLDFLNTEVNGTMPAALGSLTNLQWLAFMCDSPGWGRMSGTIPEALSLLTSMTVLQIFGYRNITGTLPAGLGALVNLQYLSLSYTGVSGSIPGTFSSLKAMTVFRLQHSNFVGSFPECVSAMRNLYYLNLADNAQGGGGFMGTIPDSISRLTNLEILTLDYNSFYGTLPEGLSMLVKLKELTLNDNNLTGPVPNVSLSDLLYMIAKNNYFTSTPSQSVNCSLISLDSNCFGGSGQKLLDYRSNLPCQYSSKTQSEFQQYCGLQPGGSTKACGGLGTCVPGAGVFACANCTNGTVPSYWATGAPNRTCGIPPLPPPPPPRFAPSGDLPKGDMSPLEVATRNAPRRSMWRSNFRWVMEPTPPQAQTDLIVGVSAVVLTGLAALVLSVLGLVVWRCCRRSALEKKDEDNEEEEDGEARAAVPSPQPEVRIELRSRGLPDLSYNEAEIWARKFTLAELAEATGGFHETNVLGIGSFGKVFRGVLRESGKVVAVKQQVLKGRWREQYAAYLRRTFVTEAQVLSKAKHINLVSLEGYCQTEGQILLVFEFVKHGSLKAVMEDATLAGTLTLQKRIHLALGAARGLNYLHNEASTPILHLDVKSDNILVDEDFNAKVADFGLAKMFQPSTGAQSTLKTRTMRGTQGYIDPYFNMETKLNKKSDVYSFGVVLLELATGWRPIPRGGGKHILTRVLQGLHETGYDSIAVPGILYSTNGVTSNTASVTSGLASSSQGTASNMSPKSTGHSTRVMGGVSAERRESSPPRDATVASSHSAVPSEGIILMPSESAASSSLAVQAQDQGPISPVPPPKEPGEIAEAGPACSPGCFKKLVLVGLWCCIYDPDKRPTMGEVFKVLESISQGVEDLGKEAVVLASADAVNLNLFPHACVGSGMVTTAALTVSDLGFSYSEV